MLCKQIGLICKWLCERSILSCEASKGHVSMLSRWRRAGNLAMVEYSRVASISCNVDSLARSPGSTGCVWFDMDFIQSGEIVCLMHELTTVSDQTKIIVGSLCMCTVSQLNDKLVDLE